ncbi:MAG: ubiquitin-associated- protein [Chloroflexi bacterium]|nr:ubiquitin-associated- protein [Chloroflexota bacterium]
MGGNFKDWRSWTKNAGEWTKNASEKVNTKNWNSSPKEFVEEIKVNSKNMVSEVERLLKESEVRRLRIRQGDRVLLDLPVAWAALGALLAPPLAAVGAIAAVATDCVIEVTRAVPEDSPAPAQPSPAQPSSAPASAQAQPKAPTGAGPAAPNIPNTPDDLNYR